jgi:hypothetical protein
MTTDELVCGEIFLLVEKTEQDFKEGFREDLRN